MTRAFTLIELLVVVAIIGILAAVGVRTYNGIQDNAKATTTINSFRAVENYIQTNLATCQLNGGGTLKLSSTRSINCDITNNTSNVNNMLDTFMNYFLDQGFENPYDKNQPALVRTGGGGGVNGRIRLDETDCPGDSSRKRMSVWVAVHDKSFGERGDGRDVEIHAMDTWCN